MNANCIPNCLYIREVCYNDSQNIPKPACGCYCPPGYACVPVPTPKPAPTPEPVSECCYPINNCLIGALLLCMIINN